MRQTLMANPASIAGIWAAASLPTVMQTYRYVSDSLDAQSRRRLERKMLSAPPMTTGGQRTST
jgi:hypothetical protein